MAAACDGEWRRRVTGCDGVCRGVAAARGGVWRQSARRTAAATLVPNRDLGLRPLSFQPSHTHTHILLLHTHYYYSFAAARWALGAPPAGCTADLLGASCSAAARAAAAVLLLLLPDSEALVGSVASASAPLVGMSSPAGRRWLAQWPDGSAPRQTMLCTFQSLKACIGPGFRSGGHSHTIALTFHHLH